MLKSKINSKLGVIILGILTTGMIILTWQQNLATEKEINNLFLKENRNPETSKQAVIYKIDFGEGIISSYKIVPSENSTVFSLLEEVAKKENFKVETKFYEGMGILVESIKGVRNGSNNKYWQYWVNEELPQVSADKKEIKTGDKVEWKFAPSSF